MFVVYVLLLENNRIYVGQTPQWRIETRWNEHRDPDCATTRWTTKYHAKEKIFVSDPFESKIDCCSYEHVLTIEIMKLFGLDSVRGGNFVMSAEGGSWWVPKNMKAVPRFTDLWENTNNIRQTLINYFRI
jgi:predicted GIY-YIG superfamily endonuclease